MWINSGVSDKCISLVFLKILRGSFCGYAALLVISWMVLVLQQQTGSCWGFWFLYLPDTGYLLLRRDFRKGHVLIFLTWQIPILISTSAKVYEFCWFRRENENSSLSFFLLLVFGTNVEKLNPDPPGWC